jgi:hypothetical protein
MATLDEKREPTKGKDWSSLTLASAAGPVIGGNQLDRALWQAPGAWETGAAGARRLAALPFDYQRRLASVLVEGADGVSQIFVKRWSLPREAAPSDPSTPRPGPGVSWSPGGLLR